MAWQIDPDSLDDSALSSDLEAEMGAHPHLEEHITEFNERTNTYPNYVDEPKDHHNTMVDHPNYCWKIDDVVFVHVYGARDQDPIYHTIEPSLTYGEIELFREVKRRVLNESVTGPEEIDTDNLEDLLSSVITVTGSGRDDGTVDGVVGRIRGVLSPKPISVDQLTFDRLRYQFQRDVLGLGQLEPVLIDPTNEDIHVLAHDNLHVYNDVFGLLKTDIDFGSEYEYDHYLRSMAERIGKPLSDAHPIVDGTLPDGSRFNVIFSDDVSVKGPSMTIRQQDEIPLTMPAITRGGTFSPMAAAYLWLAMENETSAIVAGETASGKTTTLNAMTSFIPDDSKIFTAEDTAEVVPPHDTWQQLLTREEADGDNDIDLFDLVAAALRSRPDYIIVGEARGKEVRMAFQAIQTGHPVLMTFHAGDIKSLVQRLKGNPINVPYSHLDNLDLVIFQNFIQGDDYRRCTSIYEIDRYSRELGGLITNKVFEWEPHRDKLEFTGQNNSVLLEDKIATLHGLDDSRDIYANLEYRTRIIEQMVFKDMIGYEEVNRLISSFQRDGLSGLPFNVEKPDVNTIV